MTQVDGARIGPNAIIRLIEATQELETAQRVGAIFGAAGLSQYLVERPEHMVPEKDVEAAYRAVREVVGAERAVTIAWLAGWRTGDYLLAHRIPKPVQGLMRFLPRRIATWVLLRAIQSNAWTFAGSGRVATKSGAHARITLSDCLLCGPTTRSGTYYAATFERLFRALVSADTRVREVISSSGAQSDFVIS